MAISCFPGYSGLHGPISGLVQPSWLAWTEDRWGLEGDNGSLGEIGRKEQIPLDNPWSTRPRAISPNLAAQDVAQT